MSPSDPIPAQGDAEMRALLGEAHDRISAYREMLDGKIAVVGMAARLPGSRDIGAFWNLLATRGEGLRPVDAADLAAAGVDPHLLNEPDYVPVWAGPPEADGFDAAFFGYGPREAELLDPQQRMFLECAWHALEDAGYDSSRVTDRIGVYAGASLSSHLLRAAGRADAFEAGLANIGGMVAARTSFHLDLKGPSIGVQTTCSSALVALHQAIDGLRRRDCDMALAGAVAVNQSRPEGYRHQTEGIGSPDGTCRPFDGKAAGTVFGNGAGVVVLKRLGEALADGDTIHGVLLGSAVNNDGVDKISLTAPSVAGQAEVLTAALAAARVTAGEIDFVEAHGTGTALGDPVELAALNRAYGPGLAAVGRRCALGAVKGNLGHLDAAAGMAGLIKILLAFRHRHLPGTAHFTTANPKCNLGAFDVLGEGRDWPVDPLRPRRAGLSAFGIGGTNAHLVVEEPPRPDTPVRSTDQPHLLPLSARTPEALTQIRDALAHALEADDAPDLADVAFTLQTGRRPFGERQVLVAKSRAEAVAALRKDTASVRQPMNGRPDPVFLLSGQGSQQPGMARGLYAEVPAFRSALDECLAEFDQADLLRGLLLRPSGPDVRLVHETCHAQPVLFALEYALAQTWLGRGLEPVALLGHSVGELTAACIAGVFGLSDAARLIAARGRLMQDCAPGAMLSAMLSESEARGSLPDQVEIAAVNGPRNVALAGPGEAIDDLAAWFERSGIGCKRLQTSHAFHSALMEPALDGFRKALKGLDLNAPRIPMLSNVTGGWLSDAEAVDPEYWVRHLRQPVRFADGVGQLAELDHPLLIEVGPGSGLVRLARQTMGPAGVGIASLPDSGAVDGGGELLHATGEVWLSGGQIVWEALHDGPRRRVSMPGYPFERRSFWLPPASAQDGQVQKPGPMSWFYQPVWQREPVAAPEAPPARLVLGADALRPLVQVWPPETIEVVATPGDAFQQTETGYALDPADPDACRALLAALAESGQEFGEIVCAWGLREDEEGLYRGVTALATALAQSELRPPITLISCGAEIVTGREELAPQAALALGLLPVLAQELPGVTVRSIDLEKAETGTWVAGLSAALDSLTDRNGRFALRGGYVWRLDHASAPITTAVTIEPGPFLIVGDLAQGLAQAFAAGLSETEGATLVLAGHGLPDPADWEGWLSTHDPRDPAAQMISALRALGRVGEDILVYAGDEGDAAWLEMALADAEARLGPVGGVFYTSAMGDAFSAPLGEVAGRAAEQSLARKFRGIAALRRVLAERKARFCLVQSSLSVLAGGFGFAAYAAANARIEAETACARRDGATVWQSIAWDVAETGSTGPSLHHHSELRVLSGAEVWSAARAVLSAPGAGHVVVTPGSLTRRLLAAAQPKSPQPSPVASSKRSTPYVAPRDEIEQSVAATMAELLGVPDVGAEDNFFELGGHSLLAIQIINRLRRTYQVDLPVRSLLYEAPTVAGIAAVIRDALQAQDAEAETLARLLDELEAEPAETAG